MIRISEPYEVIIAGGGPVGLFLGICLEKAGISTIILEKRTAVRSGSRSLGIHPVSLELFQKTGIADSFVDTGIKIYRGYAFTNSRKIGTISFENCRKPFNYILALPQSKTEAILERKARYLNPKLLVRGAEIIHVSQHNDHVEARFLSNGKAQTIKGSFLVGCDGKNSFIREQAGIDFKGKNYPDTYIMGDFSDNTPFGSNAAVFLCDDGLIESFPLLNQRRRWVVKTSSYLTEVRPRDIEERVAERIGHDLKNTEHCMLSSFGVEKKLAMPMVKNRIIVAGDAAHIVSPIGGQGMNLGWLGAWDLAQSFLRIFKKNHSRIHEMAKFEKRRRKAAKNTIRRAEINMQLGREYNHPLIRNTLVWLMLHTPLSNLMARVYTMRGVERWIF